MRILIVRNNYNSQAVDASMMAATYLATQGIEYTLADSGSLAGVKPNADLAATQFDMAIALGGDGTILRTARQIGESGAPILGINYGRLGFLANPNEEGVVTLCATALAGDVTEERRSNLNVLVVCEGEEDPYGEGEGARENSAAESAAKNRAAESNTTTAGATESAAESVDTASTQPHHMFALNEMAVTRGANGRIIEFGLNIAGSKLADMRGDGLVVSTATGSTAYALSAGGPLVAPGFTGLIAVPIAPHTLHSRAVVTAPNDVVEMVLENSQAERDATLFLDGELAELPAPIQKVYVQRGEVPTTLLRYNARNFYDHAADVFF